MPATSTAMDKAGLKKLLAAARQGPISCALAVPSDPAAGHCLILLHKVAPARVLLAGLKKQFPAMKTPCFGTAKVDMETDPKLVTFTLNRKISGLPKRLVRSLRGTGFTKVSVERASPGGTARR
jgi:hypothetical protein